MIGAAALLSVTATSCGEDADVPTTSTTTTSTTTADAASTTTTEVQEWSGPPVLITATTRELVAVDLRDGDHVTLANGSELADSLGILQGRFEDVDLSPDGTTVAFTFGAYDDAQPVYALYEVPVDGSSEAVTIPLGDQNSFVTRPRYSPDGRLLAVYVTDRVVVLDEQRRSAGNGAALPYPPQQLTWSGSGDQLMWLEHFERSSCCDLGAVDVDPHSGRLTSDVQRRPVDGGPYIGEDGEVATLPTSYPTYAVDRTGRYVVASDGTPGVLWWWEPNNEAAPKRLELDVEPQEIPPLAW